MCTKSYYPFVSFFKVKLHQWIKQDLSWNFESEKQSLFFECFSKYGSQCHSKQAYSLDSLQHSHPTLLHTAAWIEKVVRDRNSRKLVSAE